MKKQSLICCLLLALWATAVQAQDGSEKLSIHGYLTQAYAESDGHQLIGIPSGGTTNYRTAALQFRYNLSEKHNFVIQFSHEALGNSPFGALNEEVELDWAFYQYNFNADHSVKVGKVQIPFGIYNEIRDAGILLPFYRPPTGVYLETLFGAEAVDGVVLANTFGGGSDWALDADVYLGGWDFVDSTQAEQRAQNAKGVQFWLQTPVPGLRIGAAYRAYDSVADGATDNESLVSTEAYLVSVDASFDRFLIRAEYEKAEPDFGEYAAYYAQLGFHLNDKFSLFAQVEDGSLDLDTPFGPIDRQISDDVAFAVTYSFGPALLRLEHHQNTGLLAEDLDLAQIAILDPVDTDYIILSLSASF